MLSKKITVCIVILSICMASYSLSKTKNNNTEYESYIYNLADYIPNANGQAKVLVNQTNKKNIKVELNFYTSMYKTHYVINFNESNFSGLAEKFVYEEPYMTETAVREEIETFSGSLETLDNNQFLSSKYIKLAYELCLESKLQENK